ncbi:MAG TPA: iron-containing redox enzyme family protein [Stellaceae bacterium]
MKNNTQNVSRRSAASRAVIRKLDAAVDDFVRRTRFFHEPLTRGRAQMFVLQHRQNTRQRNSVLKLRVATNCPDWETRMRIIGACSEEVIADHAHGGGRPHWAILEDLGMRIGLSRATMRKAPLLASTQLCWLAWEALMSNRHWLEGLIANTCAERTNIPGYGTGLIHRRGWFGLERQRWGRLFKLTDAELDFFELHEEADIEHSNLGWQTIARYAGELSLADPVVKACELNLMVWERYLDGIAAGGDALDRGRAPVYV